MTLLEILIAMLVLLIGIYTVAKGFPLMMQNIRGEGDRTTMTRLAEETMARLSDNQNGLPEVITGGGSINHYTFAADMVAPHTDPNAQEDIVEVRGETFRVPAPFRTPGGVFASAPGWYALSQGPATWNSGYPYVYMLVPLTERFDDPRAAGAIDIGGNWFYVDKDNGEIVVPITVRTSEGSNTRSWNVSNVACDYTWTAKASGSAPYAIPPTHYVQGETPGDVAQYPSSGAAKFRVCTVHPAHGSGGAVDGNSRIVAGQTRAWAKIDFGRNLGTATPGPGEFTLEPNFGATLGFNPADAGLTLKVDYQLQTYLTQEDQDAIANGVPATPRRLLLLHEEQTIQPATNRADGAGVPFADIRLALKHVDSDAIFTKDLSGANLATPVHVLAIDLSTGQPYTDGNGFTLSDDTLQPALLTGYSDGVLALPLQISGAAAPYLGHVWRFYYRTLDRHNIQVQKAPRAYVDADTARTWLPPYLSSGASTADVEASRADVDYRTYQLTLAPAPGASGNQQIGIIEFGQWLADGTWAEADNTSGFTVAVNYAYWPDANTRRIVWGELHTVPVDARKVVLNHTTLDTTHPLEVMAVNGVSARARGWWLTDRGRQRQLDVETVFLANPLGLLPTVQ